jgi:hypothetical protein
VRNEGVIYGDAEYGNQSLSKICMHNAIILNFSCLVSLVGLSHRRLQHVGQSMTPEKGVEERRPAADGHRVRSWMREARLTTDIHQTCCPSSPKIGRSRGWEGRASKAGGV